jgi:hypothetical protein
LRGMVNICEPLINVVIEDKPKVLGCIGIIGQSNPARVHRLGPKGKGSGIGAPNSPIADGVPPAERRNLTHAGTGTERGKPVVSPRSRARKDSPYKADRAGESEPQGKPMGLRVKDGGGSEGQPVTGWIGVEPAGCDRERRTRATSLHAKAGRLPPGRSSRESLANRRRGEGR